MKCLGTLSDKRHPALPDVPTFLEQGLDVQFQMFFFHAFPKGTPREIVQKYSEASLRVCKNPEFIAEVEKVNGTVLGMGSKEGTEYMKKIRAQYQELAKGVM
jgi:tripartite-type tricarboxylate transporter receptor subunit TctC